MSLIERKKWIGNRQIDVVEVMDDRKDASGEPLIKVKYIQGGVEYFTKRMLEAVVTDKSTDLTDLRTRRMYPVIQEILKVLSLYGFKPHSEFEFLYSMLKGTLDERLKQASDFLWGVDDQDLSFIDLVNTLEQRDKAFGLKVDVKNSDKN